MTADELQSIRADVERYERDYDDSYAERRGADAEMIVRKVPALLEMIEYQAYQLAVHESYKDSSSPVRPLTYEEWQLRKQEATAWLYAVPVYANIIVGKDPAAQIAHDDAESDDDMPGTNLDDYVECPCCHGKRYTADGWAECGCCEGTGAGA